MHLPLSWGEDQDNISVGVLPDLRIKHTPDAANDFSRYIQPNIQTQANHTHFCGFYSLPLVNWCDLYVLKSKLHF